MKKISLSILFGFLIFNLNAQTNHTVNTVGMTFSPSNLTINLNDTVTFINTGGFHNVNGTTTTFPSNPASFFNPSGVSSGWTYVHVFTLAGTYNYHCDPHLPGMTGIIIVNSPSPALSYIPDDNFENYLEANAMGDGIALNDSVLTSAIDTITELNLENKNINEITGIEDFILLEYLECQDNSIASLDLTNNTALLTLICSDNPLTTLDLSQNTNLTSLRCRDNQLTTLDLSQNTALTYLDCSNNQLTTLDVSQNTSLSFLICRDNNLHTLDLRNGNNHNFNGNPFQASPMQSTGNINLFCIDVDSIGSSGWLTDSWSSFSTNCATTLGCTDSLACNYDSLATIDDGSCLNIYGCMDTTALNYDSLATCSDTTCLYPLNYTPLFFSEYAEGSSYNKYFEVFNPTADTIDLTNYAYPMVNNSPGNGAGVYENWNNFDSAAVILPYDVFVVAHVSADSIILANADMIVTGNSALSNGNDGMALVYGNQPSNPVGPDNGGYVILDWIGTWDGDYTNNPGSNDGWDVAGEYLATLNHTIIRKCDVMSGDTSWVNSAGTNAVNSQWTVMANDDWTDIGMHTTTPCNLVYACTDSLACNFDSSAVIDDGSCVYPGQIYQNNISICDGDSALIGGVYYSQSGLFIDSLTNIAGCDSIVHTNLAIYSQFNPISAGIPDNTIGGGGFYSGSQFLELSAYMPAELVSAMVYAQDTTLTTFQIRDDNGNVLDSTVVNVIPGGHRIYFNFNIIPGSNYQLGVDGNSNNLYRNNAGVNYPYTFGSLAAITSSSAGGQYYYFFYDIEVKQLAQPTNYSICAGDSLVIGNSIYTTTGLYTDSLTSAIGCDSLAFTNLIVYPNVSYNNVQTICSGEVTIVGNNVYDSTAIYIDTLISSFGCDSVVTTDLTVLNISAGNGTNNQTICLGDSVVVGNNTYFDAGTYLDTLTSSSGCDSILTTTIIIISASYAMIYGGKPDTTNIAPMTGVYSSYNGRLNMDNTLVSILKSAAVYAQDTNSVTFELRNSNGIVLQDMTETVYPGFQRINFNFLIPVDSNLQLGISAGGSGLYRNNAGTSNNIGYPYHIGPVTIKSANTGSTQYYYFYYDLEIMPYATYLDTNICDGDSIQIGSNIYFNSGTYIDTMVSQTGLCDSVIYTVLDVYQSPSLTITSVPNPPEICLGDSIVLEGSPGFTYYWWDNGVVSDRLVDNPTVDTWYLLTAKDSNNCVVKEDVWVSVDSCISGIDYPLVNEISIYPNPTNGVLNIISDLNIEKLSLYSVDGRLIEKTKNTSLFIKTKGIYFIKVKTSKGNIIRRIVVN